MFEGIAGVLQVIGGVLVALFTINRLRVYLNTRQAEVLELPHYTIPARPMCMPGRDYCEYYGVIYEDAKDPTTIEVPKTLEWKHVESSYAYNPYPAELEPFNSGPHSPFLPDTEPGPLRDEEIPQIEEWINQVENQVHHRG